MADIIDEKAKKYMHQYSPTKPKSKKLSAVFQKDNKPGPQSYKVAESLEKSA